MSIQAGTQTTRKHGLNHQGFTLVEICVAMAVGSVLVMSLAQYSLSAARSQKSQNLSNEFNEVMGVVGQALSTESTCTATLGNIANPVASGSPVPLVMSRPIGGSQTLLATGSLPSGLNILSITAGTPTVMGPPSSSNFTPYMLPITITAMKGPAPSATPSGGPGLNTYFVGNNYFTKTFTVGVWFDGTNRISKCTSSQDMAQEAPASPTPVYTNSGVCTGSPPTCPGEGQASCCSQSSSPTPFWVCGGSNGSSNGWSCSS
jgi:prepilin-type N-terminal cleavage/methylation domain-containing protein